MESQFDAWQRNGASGPMTPQQRVGGLLYYADQLEAKYGDSEYMPPEVRDGFMSIAASWAKGDDYVRMKWRQHFRRTWGPIETELI